MAKKIREAKIVSPSTLFIYAEQKIGKTTACLQLESAELWDCHAGADAYRGPIEEIHSYQDMLKAATENKKTRACKVVILDTTLDVVNMLAGPAMKLYKESLSGQSLEKAKGQKWYEEFDKLDPSVVLSLVDFNKAQDAVLQTFIKLVNYLKTCYEKIIFIAHSKLGSAQSEKNNLLVKEIDLPQKIREYVLRFSDQVCIAYREANEVILDFTQIDEASKLGGRFSYLHDKKITLSKLENDELTTFWYRVYPDIYNITEDDLKQEIRAKEAQEEEDRRLLGK